MEGIKKNRAREAGNGVKMGMEPRGPLEGLGAEFFAFGKKFAPRPPACPRFPAHFDAISRETGAIFQLGNASGPPGLSKNLPKISSFGNSKVDKWKNYGVWHLRPDCF